MNILIIYAHHEPTSFTGAMKNLALTTLEEQGHSVTVSDLYGQGFSAVAQKWDFVTTSGNHFNYMLEQKHAANLELAFSPDILGEIQKMQAADIILFITPIWWMSVPALLKGWFDRVLAMGVAWDTGKIFENGMMRGKQAMVVAAAGAPADYFQENGRYRSTPVQALHPINHGTLAACGFNVHEPYVALNMLGIGKDDREKVLQELQFRLQNLVSSPQWLIFYS
ncbi:MAG TPA: NAD(P)H-dependent oxidoreductase [Candidatus Saccharimonadales bacterium]|nr:NAD(P)H-dependent oxidoreductase [Candidatus Saccharimonadales bacterium]